jgi:hypothetical protein
VTMGPWLPRALRHEEERVVQEDRWREIHRMAREDRPRSAWFAPRDADPAATCEPCSNDPRSIVRSRTSSRGRPALHRRRRLRSRGPGHGDRLETTQEIANVP